MRTASQRRKQFLVTVLLFMVCVLAVAAVSTAVVAHHHDTTKRKGLVIGVLQTFETVRQIRDPVGLHCVTVDRDSMQFVAGTTNKVGQTFGNDCSGAWIEVESLVGRPDRTTYTTSKAIYRGKTFARCLRAPAYAGELVEGLGGHSPACHPVTIQNGVIVSEGASFGEDLCVGKVADTPSYIWVPCSDSRTVEFVVSEK